MAIGTVWVRGDAGLRLSGPGGVMKQWITEGGGKIKWKKEMRNHRQIIKMNLFKFFSI